MIDARELRIGNWVFDDENNLCQISSLISEKKAYNEGCETQFDTDGICVEYPNMEANYITENINPIPLTAEWLERFGFSEALNGWWSSCENYSLQDGWFRIVTDPIIECHHVHQLQNLYFALTGEELKTENK